MKLLNDLLEDHAEITRLFQQAVELGIITEQAQAILRRVKERMLAHLKRENDEFYPALRAAAGSDKELEKLLHATGRDLEDTYLLAFRFFDKYTAPAADPKGYARELGKLYAALQERILREERTLFAEYQQRIRQGGQQ